MKKITFNISVTLYLGWLFSSSTFTISIRILLLLLSGKKTDKKGMYGILKKHIGKTYLTYQPYLSLLFDNRHFVFRCDRSAGSSSKKSRGVLIAVKRDFDIEVISTKHDLCIKHAHECVRVKCSEYSDYLSAVYLAPDVENPAYDMFVEDMVDTIVGGTRVTDRILVLGSFDLLKIEWGGPERWIYPAAHEHHDWSWKWSDRGYVVLWFVTDKLNSQPELYVFGLDFFEC
jgi:hypothetical protein